MINCYIKDEVKRKWVLFEPENCIKLHCEKLEAKIFDDGYWKQTEKEKYNSYASYLCEKHSLAKWPTPSKSKNQTPPPKNLVYSLDSKATDENNVFKLSEKSKSLIEIVEKAGKISHEELFEKVDYKDYRSSLANLVRSNFIKESKKDKEEASSPVLKLLKQLEKNQK